MLISALGGASGSYGSPRSRRWSHSRSTTAISFFLEWLLNGQTPGKRMLHVRVIKQGGYALRFFDTLLRNLLRVIDFLPLFYGVGLTSLLFTRDSQRLGDLVAGTLVVYQEPVQTDSLLADLPAAPRNRNRRCRPRSWRRFPNEAISLADEYLRSRTELAPRPRQEIAAELVDLIRETSGLEPRPTRASRAFWHRSSGKPSKPLHCHPKLRWRLNSLL